MSTPMGFFARLPPELPTDVCPQPLRPRNTRKPGGVVGFPGQPMAEFPVFSSGLLAHVDFWTPNLQASYVDIVNLRAWKTFLQ